MSKFPALFCCRSAFIFGRSESIFCDIAENLLIGFLSESLVFLQKNEQMSNSLKKTSDSLIRLFLVSNLSNIPKNTISVKFFEQIAHSLIYHERPERIAHSCSMLICQERPERFAHGCSFDMSELSDSLTVAHLS